MAGLGESCHLGWSCQLRPLDPANLACPKNRGNSPSTSLWLNPGLLLSAGEAPVFAAVSPLIYVPRAELILRVQVQSRKAVPKKVGDPAARSPAGEPLDSSVIFPLSHFSLSVCE